MDHPKPIVTEIAAVLVGETSVLDQKEQGLLGDRADLHDGIDLVAIDDVLAPSQRWLHGDVTRAAAFIGTRAVSDKHLSSIIATIEILKLSRLGLHHGDQVVDGLMKPFVEVKDGKSVGWNVGVISDQVEACRVEPGPKQIGIRRIEWLRERGLDGAIGHMQEFDKAGAPRFALEGDQLLIGSPLKIAARRVAIERLQTLAIHAHQL